MEVLAAAEQAIERGTLAEAEHMVASAEGIAHGVKVTLQRQAREAYERALRLDDDATKEGVPSGDLTPILSTMETAVNDARPAAVLEAFAELERRVAERRRERYQEEQRRTLEKARGAATKFIMVKKLIEDLRKADIDIAGGEEDPRRPRGRHEPRGGRLTPRQSGRTLRARRVRGCGGTRARGRAEGRGRPPCPVGREGGGAPQRPGSRPRRTRRDPEDDLGLGPSGHLNPRGGAGARPGRDGVRGGALPRRRACARGDARHGRRPDGRPRGGRERPRAVRAVRDRRDARQRPRPGPRGSGLAERARGNQRPPVRRGDRVQEGHRGHPRRDATGEGIRGGSRWPHRTPGEGGRPRATRGRRADGLGAAVESAGEDP